MRGADPYARNRGSPDGSLRCLAGLLLFPLRPAPSENGRLAIPIDWGEALEALRAFADRYDMTADDTEDVVQSALIKAWTGSASFRGDSRLTSWLYVLLRNEFVSFARRRRSEARLGQCYAGPSRSVCHAESVLSRLTAAKLLSGLPTDQRRSLERILHHDETAAGIARDLGLAPSSVRCRVHRARVALAGLRSAV